MFTAGYFLVCCFSGDFFEGENSCSVSLTSNTDSCRLFSMSNLIKLLIKKVQTYRKFYIEKVLGNAILANLDHLFFKISRPP